ncbi:hypothetical protein HL663_10890 [Arthrobacter sp. NEB 688]|nr:hypothetical protein HL663_10890 [Arthrobacter sp. NEB 688]
MSENQTITSLRAIRRRVVDGAALVRCDGSRRDLTNYRLGHDVPGWHVTGECHVGDVLVDTTGTGRSRRITAVTPVSEVTNAGAIWIAGEDTPLLPAMSWDDVTGSHNGSRPWRRLEDAPAIAFVDDLIDAVGSRPRISVAEGRKRIALCRSRSRQLRDEALDVYMGTCEACGLQPRMVFGPDGDRAIDVHHKDPLSVSGEVRTSLEEISVVCAACHRLLHIENPPLEASSIAGRIDHHRATKGLR